MKRIISLTVSLFILLANFSCRKIQDYFRDPECDPLIETIHSVTLSGYAANVAMAAMNGGSFSNVIVQRSNDGFPCTAIVIIDPSEVTDLSFSDKADLITVAGIWPDVNTAVLSVLFTNYHVLTNTLDLVGIQTIPVVRDLKTLHVAMANQDVQINPDEDAFLSINLNTLQIQSELLRLETPRANDVYIAVTQNVYLVDISTHLTYNDPADDVYTITGGGQMIEVEGNDAEITQVAMVEAEITTGCTENPVDGMALQRVTGLESSGFPELGTVVLEFEHTCDGTALVYGATGMYAGAIRKTIPFRL